MQALKANPERAPVELKINANYITRFGQVGCRLCFLLSWTARLLHQRHQLGSRQALLQRLLHLHAPEDWLLCLALPARGLGEQKALPALPSMHSMLPGGWLREGILRHAGGTDGGGGHGIRDG